VRYLASDLLSQLSTGNVPNILFFVSPVYDGICEFFSEEGDEEKVEWGKVADGRKHYQKTRGK